jgi:Flp pilus assembly protein CpaB
MARTLRLTEPPNDTEARRDERSVVSRSGPTRRRPSWVMLGTLLVGLAGLLGAWVFTATTERISVMVAARDISPGEVITATDMRVVEMGKTGDLRAVQPSQQDLVVGRASRGPIPAGTVLNTGLFAESGQVIPAGFVVIGAALEPGAAPTAQLAAGDRVHVLGTVRLTGSLPDGSPTPEASVLAAGTVWSVERPSQGTATAKLWVSILVPVDTQTTVAQAAADGRLRLALIGAGG